MTTLVIDRRNAVISWKQGAAEIRVPDEGPRRIPLRGIERLLVLSSATLSAGLLARCWESGVSVLILSGRRHEPTARFYGAPHKDAAIRVAQTLACHRPDLCRRMVRAIVLAKIRRQAQALERLAAGRPDGRHRAAAGRAAARHALGAILGDPHLSVDRLRGHEGAAAAGYFASYVRFFAPSLGFDGRRRRPPPDPVNAALSLAYTLATFEAGRAAQVAGLDPAVGALHGLAHGRDALALDLVEPLRPRVDLFVHRLFAGRVLAAHHFHRQPDGGMLLGKAGRQHFHAAWEEAAPGLRRLARAGARMMVRALRREPGLIAGGAAAEP